MARIARRVSHRAGPAAGADLPTRYPAWFALGVVAITPGWTGLVDRLFADLDATLAADDREAFQVAAVREREGRLSIETFAPVAAAAPLIAAAVAQSARICQSCGAAGRHRRFEGWAATLCAACRRRLGAIRIGAR